MISNISEWLVEPPRPITGQMYVEPNFFETKEAKMYDGISWVDMDMEGSGLITFLRTGIMLALVPIRISDNAWAIGTEHIRVIGDAIGKVQMSAVCIESPDIYSSQEQAQAAINNNTFTQSIIKFGI